MYGEIDCLVQNWRNLVKTLTKFVNFLVKFKHLVKLVYFFKEVSKNVLKKI